MSQNVHITCQVFDDRTGLISQKLSEKTIKGFFVIQMKPACSGAMKEHIFSTHNNLVVNYDLKLEEFEIDLDYLLGDIKESEILNFLENDTEEKPVSIQDVKKKFHLKTLSKGMHATKYMSYSVMISHDSYFNILIQAIDFEI